MAFSLSAVFLAANFFIESVALERFIKFSSAALTFDIYKMCQADLSAALRIVPSILCIQQIDLSTVDGWFGHGIDYVSKFMSNYISGVEIGYNALCQISAVVHADACQYGFGKYDSNAHSCQVSTHSAFKRRLYDPGMVS